MLTFNNRNGVVGEESTILTCVAMLTGAGIPMFTWTGPVRRGPITGDGNGPTFTDNFHLGRLKQYYAGEYTCMASIGTSSMSNLISITVNGKFYTPIQSIFVNLYYLMKFHQYISSYLKVNHQLQNATTFSLVL